MGGERVLGVRWEGIRYEEGEWEERGCEVGGYDEGEWEERGC